MKRSILFLPVEIYPRELISRFLLACRAAENGFDVVIGSVDGCINLAKAIGNGIFVDKCLATSHSNLHEQLKRHGLSVVSMDEEGLSSENNSLIYKNFRLSEKSLGIVDIIFCWGDGEKRAIDYSFPQYCKKTIVVGNPRLDLAKNSNMFKQNGERYVLLISNIAIINANGIGFHRKQLNEYGYLNSITENDFDFRVRKRWVTLFELAKFYMELVEANPHLRFILRPHPSENIEFWQDFLAGYRNCKIEYSHDYETILTNAEIVVHSSCTSGVFAALQDKKTLCFTPINDDPYSNFVANRVSTFVANDLNEGLMHFNRLLKMSMDEVAKINRTRIEKNAEYLYVQDGKLCSDMIVDKLCELADKKPIANMDKKHFQHLHTTKAQQVRKEFFSKSLHKLLLFKVGALRMASKFMGSDFVLDKNIKYTKAYSDQTFKKLTRSTLDYELERFRKQGLASGIFYIKEISPNLFVISNHQEDKIAE
jgi:surface carbohydrate biosynthesis protein